MKEILESYVREGKIDRQDHPTLPLSVYKYTRETAYNKDWDDITRRCRGLVVCNETGAIVAEPFHKFFNFQEHMELNTMPTGSFRCMEKLDGSLIIISKYRGEWLVNTSGSFTSEQAVMAREIWEKVAKKHGVEARGTLMFELVGPDNPHICKYPENKLVFLGSRSESGTLVHAYDYGDFWEGIDEVECAREIDVTNMTPQELYDRNISGEEGYVLVYEDGTMLKVKFEDYVNLHYYLSDVTPKKIVQRLAEGQNILDDIGDIPIPDEKYDEIKFVVQKAKVSHDLAFATLKVGVPTLRKSFSTRKDQALWIQDNLEGELRSAMFSLLDDKDDRASQQIWKFIIKQY